MTKKQRFGNGRSSFDRAFTVGAVHSKPRPHPKPKTNAQKKDLGFKLKNDNNLGFEVY